MLEGEHERLTGGRGVFTAITIAWSTCAVMTSTTTSRLAARPESRVRFTNHDSTNRDSHTAGSDWNCPQCIAPRSTSVCLEPIVPP